MKKVLSIIGLLLSLLVYFGKDYVLPKQHQSYSSVNKTTGSSTQEVTAQEGDALAEWNYKVYPAYYKVLGVSNINTAEFPSEGKIVYSSLDELGRTGVARGTLTYDMYKASIGSKQSFSNAENPSGFDTVVGGKRKNWNSVKGQQLLTDGDGRTYNGWFYNRSHLIGDALGGDEVQENVVTGTRFQNVGSRRNDGGMRYSESKVENYFKSNGVSSSVVWYEATPNYSGSELVPRSVTVRFKSQDGTLDEAVLVSNTVKDYRIDYNTGDFNDFLD